MPTNTELIAAIHDLAEVGGGTGNDLARAIVGLSTQLSAAVEEFATATAREVNLETWAATQGYNINTDYTE